MKIQAPLSLLGFAAVIAIGCGGGGSSSTGSPTTGSTGSSTGGTTNSTSASGTSGGTTTSTSTGVSTSTGTGTTTGSTGSTQLTEFDTSISSSSLQLDDGGHYAMLGLVATGSGQAVIQAKSALFDVMEGIEVVNPDGTSQMVGEDDDGGGGTNSAATISVSAGSHYTVIVTSPAGDPSGALQIFYSSSLLSPDGRAQIKPRAPKP